MPDDFISSGNGSSIYRGRRRAPRTETCRPCWVWLRDDPELAFQGVVMNISPFGMCIRMLDAVAPRTSVMIQLMRDEAFQIPLSAPLAGVIVWNGDGGDGFTDHGVELERPDYRRSEPPRPVVQERGRILPKLVRGKSPRMYHRDTDPGTDGSGNKRHNR